jgi:GntR family transcriptional regulator, transcriptional repressor for pyruvate dehydrogenase complex
MEVTDNDLESFFSAVLPLLDERQSRIVAGAVAAMLGHGGTTAVSRASGASRSTIGAGTRETAAGSASPGRVRRPGGGRKLPDDWPAAATALRHHFHPDGDDAQSAPLHWTSDSASELAAKLSADGFTVSSAAMRARLRALGYAQQASPGPARKDVARRRLLETFEQLLDMVEARQAAGQPVIVVHVDADDAAAQAEGESQEPSAEVVRSLAAATIARWWTQLGMDRYPRASHLLICPEGRLAHSARAKWEADTKYFSRETGLSITVVQVPPGTYAWQFDPDAFEDTTMIRRDGRTISLRVSIRLVSTVGLAARSILAFRGGDGTIAGSEFSRLLGDRSDPPREAGSWKVAERIAHDIAREISASKLRPGARLPSEATLQERFKVSRGSLREAMRLLEILGVIRVKAGPGGGAVVMQVSTAAFTSTTTFYYHLLGVTISDLLEARRVLEPLLVRLVTERREPALLDKLDALSTGKWNEQLDQRPWQETQGRLAQIHLSFIGTGNPVLDLFAQSLQEAWLARHNPGMFRHEAHHDDDHKEIARAVLAGNSDLAEELMREHMTYLKDFAVHMFPHITHEIVDWK